MLNSQYSISGLVISYEFIVFTIFYIGYIDLYMTQNLISPFIFINIFILCVMYFTSCQIPKTDLIKLSFIKTLLLYFALKFSNMNVYNLIIGWLMLIIYSYFSDENSIYKCNINDSNMKYTFLISTIIYIQYAKLI